MTIASIEQIHALRVIAEHRLDEAKAAANALRVAHLLTALGEHFPQHTLAVLGRDLDSEHASLLQILANRPDVVDLDELQNSAIVARLTPDQQSTVALANGLIRLMGPDDDLLAHLKEGEEAHDDWIEFQLPFDGHDTLEAEPATEDQEHA